MSHTRRSHLSLGLKSSRHSVPKGQVRKVLREIADANTDAIVNVDAISQHGLHAVRRVLSHVLAAKAIVTARERMLSKV